MHAFQLTFEDVGPNAASAPAEKTFVFGNYYDITLPDPDRIDDVDINDEIIGVYFLANNNPADFEVIFFLLADKSIVRAGKTVKYASW